MNALEIARIAHEANRGLQYLAGEPISPSWDDAPAYQTTSTLAGVERHLVDPCTAEESHGRWLAHKRAEGWTYGPEKDEARKQHPCCLEYSELPAEQRRKDVLFIAIVRALELTP